MHNSNILDTRGKLNCLSLFKVKPGKILMKLSLYSLCWGGILILISLLYVPNIDKENTVVCGKYLTYEDEDLNKPKYHLIVIDKEKNNEMKKLDPIEYSSFECKREIFIQNEIPNSISPSDITFNDILSYISLGSLLEIMAFILMILGFLCNPTN